MKSLARFTLIGTLLVGLTISGARATAQMAEAQTIQAARAVLEETMAKPMSKVPAALLKDCHGVAIVPNVIKGSFIVGARHGKGLLFVRDPGGLWHAPVFIDLTGGNIGWQVGVQASDIILVFKTERSVQGILSGKLTLGGDVSAAAGPVGRQAAVATDGRLQAEIYTYSRSRGLFAGVSIDGSVVRVDQLATGDYYRSPAPGQPVVIPQPALELTQTIAAYADQIAAVAAIDEANNQAKFAQQVGTSSAAVIHNQLLQIAPSLFELLSPQWASYLALPLSPQDANGIADINQVRECLQRYDRISTDPQFAQLAARPEFRSVHGLLKHYEHAIAPQSMALQLPPPPTIQ